MSAGDVRPLPLHLQKNHLAKMLRRCVDGIILNDFEQGEIGPDLFRHACLMGLEGIVSKHKDQPYRAGRSKQPAASASLVEISKSLFQHRSSVGSACSYPCRY
jgi:hypothetical protein